MIWWFSVWFDIMVRCSFVLCAPPLIVIFFYICIFVFLIYKFFLFSFSLSILIKNVCLCCNHTLASYFCFLLLSVIHINFALSVYSLEFRSFSHISLLIMLSHKEYTHMQADDNCTMVKLFCYFFFLLLFGFVCFLSFFLSFFFYFFFFFLFVTYFLKQCALKSSMWAQFIMFAILFTALFFVFSYFTYQCVEGIINAHTRFGWCLNKRDTILLCHLIFEMKEMKQWLIIMIGILIEGNWQWSDSRQLVILGMTWPWPSDRCANTIFVISTTWVNPVEPVMSVKYDWNWFKPTYISCLIHVHGPRLQIAFVADQHHWHLLRIFNTFDLLSIGSCKFNEKNRLKFCAYQYISEAKASYNESSALHCQLLLFCDESLAYVEWCLPMSSKLLALLTANTSKKPSPVRIYWSRMAEYSSWPAVSRMSNRHVSPSKN